MSKHGIRTRILLTIFLLATVAGFLILGTALINAFALSPLFFLFYGFFRDTGVIQAISEMVWSESSTAIGLLTVIGFVSIFFSFVEIASISYGSIYSDETSMADQLGVSLAQCTDPNILNRVERFAVSLDIPSPNVLIAETDQPHALSIGLRKTKKQLILSEKVIEVCNNEELDAVIAHELGHIKNRDGDLMTFLALPVTAAEINVTRSSKQLREAEFDTNRRGGAESMGIQILRNYYSSFILFWGRLLMAFLSRQREFAADRIAADATGDPAAVASAITRLDESIEGSPSTDLRNTKAIGALEMVPTGVAPKTTSTVLEDVPTPGGDNKTTHPSRRLLTPYFRTHPETEDRLKILTQLTD